MCVLCGEEAHEAAQCPAVRGRCLRCGDRTHGVATCPQPRLVFGRGACFRCGSPQQSSTSRHTGACARTRCTLGARAATRCKSMFETVIALVGGGSIEWDALAAQGLGLPEVRPARWREWVRGAYGEEVEGLTLQWGHAVAAAVVCMWEGGHE